MNIDISSNKGLTKTIMVSCAGIIGATLVLLLLFRMSCVTFVDNYELGYGYDKISGKIEVFKNTGYITQWPLIYSIHSIDLRPYQVSITPGSDSGDSRHSSQNTISKRVLNAKLVRFNPNGLATFIEWHGRGAGDSTNDLLMILKAYAFDRDEGRDCPFLTIVSELSPKNPPVKP